MRRSESDPLEVVDVGNCEVTMMVCFVTVTMELLGMVCVIPESVMVVVLLSDVVVLSRPGFDFVVDVVDSVSSPALPVPFSGLSNSCPIFAGSSSSLLLSLESFTLSGQDSRAQGSVAQHPLKLLLSQA